MPLPDGMPPVAQFDFNLFPGTLRDWAKDIVERIQCPPDFVVVVIMAALAAVIGRKIGVRPQEFTDWTVICNMWAFLIGRPGVLKSPAMEAALAPLKRLAALAVERFQVEITEFENTKIVEKLRVEAAEKAARAALKKDPGADLSRILRIEKTEAPILARYIANDTTAAALGELHRQNPNGLLVFRDELVSLLKMLDREDNAEARGFYLTGWNGDSAYTFDRITRGFHLNIPAVCLSLVGSTQPGRIAQYVKAAVNGGVGDDGFLQRFGLLVWPDVSGVWRDVDRWPDSRASQQAHRVFERLDRFDPLSVGAIQDTGANGRPEGIPYLRFDPAGLGLFREWRQELEARLRFDEVHSALESHLSKYRKLVPGLALIIHLANGEVGSVGRPAVLRALAWAEYLETHAKRLYASVTAPDAATARAILKKISSGALPSAFTIREVWRPQWTGLTDLDHIKSGINMLTERDWLIEVRKDTGGRPTFEYRITPRAEGSI
jgi:putative DNA primase/helicase